MEPSCPLRVPLIRVLSDAHTTQHRLHKMGGHCYTSLSTLFYKDVHVMHIIWDCPRFDELPRDWPDALLKHDSWPNSALNSVICTQKLSNYITKKLVNKDMSLNCLISGWNCNATETSMINMPSPLPIILNEHSWSTMLLFHATGSKQDV